MLCSVLLIASTAWRPMAVNARLTTGGHGLLSQHKCLSGVTMSRPTRSRIGMSGSGSMLQLSQLGQLAEKYDAFLLDQFGVIHDGQTAYEGAVEAVTSLQRAGKKVT